MKNIYLYCTLCFLLCMGGCVTEYSGKYSFIIKNSTQETVTLKFLKALDYGNEINKEEVILLPMEEKKIRMFSMEATYPKNVIRSAFDERFSELVFDTYVNGEKLDKELWLPENWTYYSKSKWEAEYKMTITNEMIVN